MMMNFSPWHNKNPIKKNKNISNRAVIGKIKIKTFPSKDLDGEQSDIRETLMLGFNFQFNFILPIK